MVTNIYIYIYYIPERAVVKNATLRNLIIDRGKASVNNQIPQGGIFYYRPLKNVIFILLYQPFTPGSPFT